MKDWFFHIIFNISQPKHVRPIHFHIYQPKTTIHTLVLHCLFWSWENILKIKRRAKRGSKETPAETESFNDKRTQHWRKWRKGAGEGSASWQSLTWRSKDASNEFNVPSTNKSSNQRGGKRWLLIKARMFLQETTGLGTFILITSTQTANKMLMSTIL